MCQTLDNLPSTIFWHPISQNGWIHFKLNYPILDHYGVLLVWYNLHLIFQLICSNHILTQYFTWTAYSWKHNFKVRPWHISFLKLNYSISNNDGVLIWWYLDPIFQFTCSNHILTNILTKLLYLGIAILKCTFEKSKILERKSLTCVLKWNSIFVNIASNVLYRTKPNTMNMYLKNILTFKSQVQWAPIGDISKKN